MKTTATRSGVIRWALPVCVTLGAMGVMSHYTAATPAPAFPSPQPTTIAIVDLVKLMDGLRKTVDLNNQEIAKIEERNKGLNDLSEQVKAKEEELKLLPKTEEKQIREKVAALYELNQTRKARFDALQRVIDFEKGEIIRELYEDVQNAALAYAKKNGFDLVLVDDRAMEVPPQATRDQMQMVIQSKRILFAADTLDITPALVQEMNNQYQAVAPPPSAAAPTPPPPSK